MTIRPDLQVSVAAAQSIVDASTIAAKHAKTHRPVYTFTDINTSAIGDREVVADHVRSSGHRVGQQGSWSNPEVRREMDAINCKPPRQVPDHVFRLVVRARGDCEPEPLRAGIGREQESFAP
jgi:hypothetical protein